MNIKISFVLPLYNVEKYIAQCIDHLCSQAEQCVEFILVDDGSADKTLSICKEYEKKDSRIRVFHQQNQGANVARNKGLEEANGEWVCFADGDDWIEDNFCLALNDYLSEDYDIIIYSNYTVHGEKRKKASSVADRIAFHREDFEDLQIAALNALGPYKYNLKYFHPAASWNKLYRRSFLEKNHLKFIPELKKIQDLTFNMQVYSYAQAGIYVNMALYNYRYNPDSVTNRYQDDIVQTFDDVHRFLVPFVLEKSNPLMEDALWERVATHMRTCVVRYFCNKKNRKKYTERKKEFSGLLGREPYASAIEKVNLNHFPVKERILSWAIKNRSFAICQMLCFFYNIL